MANDFRDDYGTFVANNYTRCRELARRSRNENECDQPPQQRSTAAHIQRSLYHQPEFSAKYYQGTRQSNLGWGSLDQEAHYLSLDSDSDSGSSKSCCSSCGVTLDGSSISTFFACDCNRSRQRKF
uniref:Nuclear receptor domain-containing protein n=1 Tax=Mesocestoides corti TaxID=53468 RepID=A0A5K3ER40_MESCO